MIDHMLALDHQAILEAPATPEQLLALRQTLGAQTPELLVELLSRTNGGELACCRFEPSPYLPEAGVDLWQHVADHYPPSDLIDRREFLPLGNDYGEGLYCLNLRHQPPCVTFVPFHARTEDEFSLAGETFEAFLAETLSELERRSRVRRLRCSLPLEQPRCQELSEVGVELRFVDRQQVIQAERESSFCDQELLALYEDETRSLFFTLGGLESKGTMVHWQLLGSDGQRVNNGSGSQHIRGMPVWSLTLEHPLQRGSRLELILELDG